MQQLLRCQTSFQYHRDFYHQYRNSRQEQCRRRHAHKKQICRTVSIFITIFGGSDIYFRKILSQVKQFIDASNVIVGEYMCQGGMPQSVRERYLKMKEAPDHPQNLDVLIQNFDCALSHPDANDLEKLKEAVMNSSF